MSLQVVHEIEEDDGVNNSNQQKTASQGILIDSDEVGSYNDDEDFVEEEVKDVPRVEFIPRERNPVSSGRPRDNRGRGRGAAEQAQEEDLRTRNVRGRLNLAMVDATFADVPSSSSASTPFSSSPPPSSSASSSSSSVSPLPPTPLSPEQKNSTTSSSKMGENLNRPSSATSLTTAALIPDQSGTLGSTNGSDQDLSKTESKRLQNEFAMYLEQGKQFAKESLISRLELELEDVERELAYIDQFRSPDNKRKRPSTAGPKGRGSAMNAVRSARPSTAGHRSQRAGTSGSGGGGGSGSGSGGGGGSRPSTANRSRPSTANRSRPSTANRSRPGTATRARGVGGKSGEISDENDGILDYASDDSDFAVPETREGKTAGGGSSGRPSTATLRSAGSKRGDSGSGGQRQRPSTAGPLRAGKNPKNGRAGRPSTAGNNGGNRSNGSNGSSGSNGSNGSRKQPRSRGGSRRPASSPLVRVNQSADKFSSDPGFVKGEIAGYKPPNLIFDDDTLARARTLSRSDISDIFKLNDKSGTSSSSATPALEACLRVGIQPTDLLPRPVSKFTRLTVGFQTLQVGKEEAYQRWSAYDEQRQKWLASVLFEKVRIIQERSHAANENHAMGGGGSGSGSGGKRPSTAPARGRGPAKERTIKDRVQKAVNEEQERVDMVTKNRNRTHKARMKENAQLRKEREEWAALQKRKTDRAVAALKKRKHDEKVRAKKHKERADAITKIRKEKQRMDEERLLMGGERQGKLERRLALLGRQKQKETKLKKTQSLKRQQHRATVSEERSVALKMRADAARHRMAVKEGHVMRLFEKKNQELERKKKDAVFKAQTLRERRERIRRQQEYGRNSLAAKLTLRAARQKKITQLETAVLSERRAMYKNQLVAQHKLDASTSRLATETPGPGSYKLPTTLNLNAGRKIGKSSAASYIDIVVNRASKIPAPGQYGDVQEASSSIAVKFSTAFVPSDLEWAIKRAGETPAPDAYQSKISKGLTGSSTSAKIGNSQGKGELEFIMMRSASMPGPHDYYEGLPPQSRTPLRALAREVGLG